jgi:hypothetical protein
MRTLTSRLTGIWITDPEDSLSLNRYGTVTLEFKDNGEFFYIIHKKEGDKVLHHNFRVEYGILIVEQDREERTPFWFSHDNRLIFLYDGKRLSYIKKDQ